MKTLIKSIFAIAIISAFTLSSCGKYEDGPKISFASKKSRLCGDWSIEQALHNGTDVTSSTTAFLGANFEWQIEKDGGYKQVGSFTDEGKWSLGEDKDDVTFTSNVAGSTADTYRILRLKSKELWLKQTQSNGDIDIYHLKQ